MKGFTLIELLGVIILLGIIALVSAPIVIDILENSKKESNAVQIKSIKKAAKSYVNGNLYSFSGCDTEECSITIGELKENGYLSDREIKNYETNEIYSNSEIIKIIKEDEKFKFIFPSN